MTYDDTLSKARLEIRLRLGMIYCDLEFSWSLYVNRNDEKEPFPTKSSKHV